MRTLILALALLPGLIGSALAEPLASAAPVVTVVEPHVVVNADVVRLGDVFLDAVEGAERVIARAPDPGRSLHLGRETLHRVTRAAGLEWLPAADFGYVTVEREGREVSGAELAGLVQAALETRHPGQNFEVSVAPRYSFHVAAGHAADLEVLHIDLDARTGDVTATLARHDADGRASHLDIRARAEAIVHVPVPLARIYRKDVIEARDVEMVAMPVTRLGGEVAERPEDVVGLAAQRTLSPGQPIRLRDVARPEMVARGERVTLIAKGTHLNLTANGEALDAGALGDVIRVRNSASKRVIEAEITGPGRLRVAMPVDPGTGFASLD